MTTETPDLLSTALDQGQPDPLTVLVGEGKKFKDATALAAAKIESDKFIETLKAEAAELRKELADKSKGGTSDVDVKALIERIEAATAAKPGDNKAGSLSREDIEKLVKEGVTAAQSAASKRDNYVKANAELLNHFKGDADQASKHLKAKVGALGLTNEALTEIAQSNPKMFRELFIPSTRQTGPNPSTLPPGKTGPLDDSTSERGKSYYSNLRKEMGHKFWDPAIQQQLMRDRATLGDKYNTI